MPDDYYADPEVCQAILLDYARNPRCAGVSDPATHAAETRNPACGDLVKLTFQLEDGRILQARTRSAGCAVSQASASLLAERLEGLTTEAAGELTAALHRLLHGQPDPADPALLDRLQALSIIIKNPARVRCASLALSAAQAALADRTENP